MKMFEHFAAALVDCGAQCLFGVMGDGNMYVADQYARGKGRYVAACNEAGAVLMAGGYAQAIRRVGFATVTHGPGLTNTVTALVDAVRSRTPVVVVAGATSERYAGSLQRIAQEEVAAAAGAAFMAVPAASLAVEYLVKAADQAWSAGGPVVLNVGADLWWQEVDPKSTQRGRPPAAQAVPAPDGAALDRALGLIVSSNRPLLLAGGGALDEASRDAICRLGRRLGSPVSTTLRAKGLFGEVPDVQDLGIFGTLASDAALDVIAATDCVVAFGASVNPWTTYNGSLLEGKRIVHVDRDAAAFGRHIEVDLTVTGDVAVVADHLERALDEAGITRAPWSKRGRRATQQHAATESGGAPLDVRAVLSRIDAGFAADRILVCDSGRYVGQALSVLNAKALGSYVHTMSFGSIGLGMGYAIGASAGRPDCPVLLAVGDGGFMLGGLTEFNTAARYGLDVTVVVLNDGSYGAEFEQFQQRGLDPTNSLFSWPDLAPVASALGGRGYTVRETADLEAALAGCGRGAGPVLIDVKLDPATMPPLHRV